MTMARIRIIRTVIGVVVLAACVYLLLANPVSAAMSAGWLG